MKYSAPLVGLFALFFLSIRVVAEPVSNQVSCRDIPELVKEVSVLRGLPLKYPVRCIEMGREDYVALKRKSYLEEISGDRLRSEESAFKLVGLIDHDFPYSECLAESYTQSLIASYDARQKAILLPIGGEGIDRSVLAHELVHALQDQHFGLEHLQSIANRASDSALALAALVEGDALLLQTKISGGRHKEAQSAQIHPHTRCGIQSGLEAQFDFPYNFGILFAERITSQLGFVAIDRAFTHPIRCTSRILHNAMSSHCPEWESLSVSKGDRAWIEAQLNGKASEVFVDSLGEYTLGIILSPQLGRGGAILAVKGWAGDKLTLWQGPQGGVVSLVTEWVNIYEAREFVSSFNLSIAQRLSASIDAEAGLWQLSKGDSTIRLNQSGNRVTLILRGKAGEGVSLFGRPHPSHRAR